MLHPLFLRANPKPVREPIRRVSFCACVLFGAGFKTCCVAFDAKPRRSYRRSLRVTIAAVTTDAISGLEATDAPIPMTVWILLLESNSYFLHDERTKKKALAQEGPSDASSCVWCGCRMCIAVRSQRFFAIVLLVRSSMASRLFHAILRASLCSSFFEVSVSGTGHTLLASIRGLFSSDYTAQCGRLPCLFVSSSLHVDVFKEISRLPLWAQQRLKSHARHHQLCPLPNPLGRFEQLW